MAIARTVENKILSILVFIPIGLISLGYVIFKNEFAKVHIQLACLHFPVFIGEILLFYCLCLLVFHWVRCPPELNYFYIFILVYLVWFVFKTATGYIKWGPLALRHAALFYYPSFFLIGYTFFNRDVFTKRTVPLLFAIIVGVFAGGYFDHYWIFTFASLGGILILATEEKKWAYLMTAALLIVVPYIFLFKTARMMFVANTVSLLFLAGAGMYLSKTRILFKIIVVIFLLAVISLSFYKFFVLGGAGRYFVSPAIVMEHLKQEDAIIQEKKGSFHRTPLKSNLYNPYPPNKPKVIRVDWQTEMEGEKTTSINNILFRLFIWRDMFEDWKVKKPLMGIDFGRPLRSISLEVLGWAPTEWSRDGWIEPHNSYFNILYRAGIVGIILVVLVWGALGWFIKLAFVRRSWTLILLAAILLNWMVAANFLLILELPYTSIPFWTLAGMGVAYAIKR